MLGIAFTKRRHLSLLPAARTEDTTATSRWQNLVLVHNQHIQANINAGNGIYTGIPPPSPLDCLFKAFGGREHTTTPKA
ncbi:hypothetical protein GPALN_004527 [Globodera pallida]|nr:hypothetical protein GPALN_004527 [Globodera pallida]